MTGVDLRSYTEVQSERESQREPVPAVLPVGPFDTAAPSEILDGLRALPGLPSLRSSVHRVCRFSLAFLRWLETAPGQTWQERWVSVEADYGHQWSASMSVSMVAAMRDGEGRATDHGYFAGALGYLVQLRVIRPSYRFLTSFHSRRLYTAVRSVLDPELFVKAEEAGGRDATAPRHVTAALNVLTMIVIQTGKNLGELTGSDIFEFRDAMYRPGESNHPGLHGAWQLLVRIGQIPAGTSLVSASRPGQRPTAELVDRYRIKSRHVREGLIRYLEERRAGVDYSTLLECVRKLAGNFWADIEKHHPGIDSLHLPDEVAAAWKERLRYVVRGGQEVPRKTYFEVLMRVRSFYLDLAQWALEDPSWAPWAVPCPIRRGETDGLAKTKKAVKAEIHQRIRERLPHLPRMVDAAEAWKNDAGAFLKIAEQVPVDTTFEFEGRRYRRTLSGAERKDKRVEQSPSRVLVADLSIGEVMDLSLHEDQAFWAWACVETLRHTGIRIEELLELTHLALVSYRLPDTGEVVPLMQIVPSKSNEERLLLVTPELASVLASIVQRLRQNTGAIPLVARYDQYERLTCPELPHLFQRQSGWYRRVISPTTVAVLLNEVLERTGLSDRLGHPLHYTPHDFRRMFSTEAVTGGLPIHIAAKILGHANINTTEGYTVVFQDDLIRAYRSFVDRRRTERPGEEYREPTTAEWIEFQEHFALRKLELGDCGRPYGTPCAHEHAPLTELARSFRQFSAQVA